ncbi:MAG: anti-sigma factor [Hyphomonadaceae bacterium]
MVNDETLCAYIDGELDGEERARVDRLVLVNPGVALRLKQLRKADAVLRAAFCDDDAAIVEDEAPPARRDFGAFTRRFAPLAAASLVGVLVGMFAPTPLQDTAPTAVSAAISRVLDDIPSGQSATVGEGILIPAQTMLTETGVACRQYRWEASADAVDGIACRENGGWRLQAQIATLQADNSVNYQAAAADSADPLGAALDALGAVAVLDESEEAALIETGWASTSP